VLIRIQGVLDAEQLSAVRDLLAKAPFVDGRISAGKMAGRAKNTEQLSPDAIQHQPLNNLVMGALVRHPIYKAAVLPQRIATPFYVRYTAGMGYGEHIDDPVMGAGDRYRSDVAITLFLNRPEEYEGGELSVQTAFGPQTVKLPAGDAVLYPASSRHSVTKVRSGQRLVAVTWAQSLIREPERRELLYELHLAREALLTEKPESDIARHVDNAYVNLVRMWAEV
jgi:PKHD-type hydroxylase